MATNDHPTNREDKIMAQLNDQLAKIITDAIGQPGAAVTALRFRTADLACSRCGTELPEDARGGNGLCAMCL